VRVVFVANQPMLTLPATGTVAAIGSIGRFRP